MAIATKQFLKIIALMIVFSSTALGHNTYFLPGDAFFFTRVDQRVLTELESAESPVLQYGSPFNAGMGCGYIGYSTIQLEEMSDETKAALVKSYQQFETEIKDRLLAESQPNSGGFGSPETAARVEINVFVYSADYDWKEHGIGIQYNENWADESVAFGVKRKNTILSAFSPYTVALNWRDAELVEPLGVECPELPKGHGENFHAPWVG